MISYGTELQPIYLKIWYNQSLDINKRLKNIFIKVNTSTKKKDKNEIDDIADYSYKLIIVLLK